jgi:hypothetical protein
MKIIVANNFHSNFEKNKNRKIRGKKCKLKIQKQNDFLQYIEKITIREMIGGVWFP